MKNKKTMAIFIAAIMAVSAIVVVINIQEKASALTPGYNSWGDCRTNVKVGVQYSGDSLDIDTSGWGSTDVHYLFYPVYRNVDTGNGYSASEFTWEGPYRINGYAVKVTPTGITTDTLDTGGLAFSFNRSGMFIFDDQITTHLGNDPSTYNGSLWVNTSTNYTIDNIADFYFNTTNDITIYVRDYLGDVTPATISIQNPDSSTAYHGYRPSGYKTLGSSNFTMAGLYKIDGYHDTDYDGTSTGIYAYIDGKTNYEMYNTSNDTYGYGNPIDNPLFPTGGTGDPTSGGDVYNFSNIGPWDPPEYNATPVTFRVKTGVPVITLTNASPVYWGFGVRIDVNVTDYAGNGIANGSHLNTPQGQIKIKKGSNYYDNDTDANSDVNWYINATNQAGHYTIEIPRASEGWSTFTNGTWYVVFEKDINGDGVDEWNGSKSFSITSSSPSVDLKITNDGYSTTGSITDKKIDVPRTDPTDTGPEELTQITFQIIGRGITGKRMYYGDDSEEDWKNITITGDFLYAPVPTDTGGASGLNELQYRGDGTWRVNLTPTKPGGQIKIAINWPGTNNGSDYETIDIINGTNVEITSHPTGSFKVSEDQTIIVKVTSQSGIIQEFATVYLFWEGNSEQLNSTTNAVNNYSKTLGGAGMGQNGEYSFWVKPSDQGTSAPKNITIAVKTANTNFWGYAKLRMEKRHNIQVFSTVSENYSGNNFLTDISINLTGGGVPTTGGGDDTLYVCLRPEGGTALTGVDLTDNSDFPITNPAVGTSGDLEINNQAIILSPGRYVIYVYNSTCDSSEHNATLIIHQYTVTSSPSVLAWLIDTEQDMTFQVNSPITTGTLRLLNMTNTPNASSVTTPASTQIVTIENGIGTLDDVNATTLGNITFEYQPEGGQYRLADGMVQVTTPIAEATPSKIYVGESTAISIELFHPDAERADRKLPGILVGIDQGVNLNASILAKIPTAKNTGTDSKVTFGIKAEATGNATIYIKGGTDPNNPQVITAEIRKTMYIDRPASVKEGQDFEVKIEDNLGNLITDVTIYVTFNGETEPTTTGKITLTAPDVSQTLAYTIEATAEGYNSPSKDITVIFQAKLYIIIEGATIDDEGKYVLTAGKVLIKAGGDDGNEFGITVSISKDDIVTQTGTAPLTVDLSGGEGDYIVTATKTGYTPADEITLKITPIPDQPPGFELLTLIAAIGIAFILLRRRRKN